MRANIATIGCELCLFLMAYAMAGLWFTLTKLDVQYAFVLPLIQTKEKKVVLGKD